MEDIRICYIGDSFVNGAGDPKMLGWAGRLSVMSQNSKQEITHYNLGVRRDTTTDILARWESETASRLLKSSINCAVFSFGVHDTMIENGRLRVSLVDSMKNAREILGRAKVKYNVLMIGPPPIDNAQQNIRIKSYDKAYATVCQMLGINYFSIFNRLVEDKRWIEDIRSNDGVHPREEGYELLANSIYSCDSWWFV